MLLADKRAEFERHLWDHASDAFQMKFDDRRRLTESEQRMLQAVYDAVVLPEDAEALRRLRAAIRQADNGMSVVLQVCGLTRNKIITDLRASASVRERSVKLPSSYVGLTHPDAWRAAGPYLLSRLRSVLGGLDPSNLTLDDVFEALNQSTWPGYIRQERAKRSGHEAEYRIATLLASVDVPFEPFEKADNPLCRDAQIDGISFDLVVPHVRQPVVVVKSTVHTANIGQYGESKDDLEIREARGWIDTRYKGDDAPTLLAFIDGVGFRSNRAGLDGVLNNSDEFCQFKTIWKVALISAVRLDLPVQVALSGERREEFAPFIAKWKASSHIVRHEELASTVDWLEAGDALIRRAG